MKCKDCRKGKYDKRTDTVFCEFLGKTLLFNRDNCEHYEEKPIVTKIKEKKYKDLSKYLVELCKENDINMHRILNTREDIWCFTFWKTEAGSFKIEIDSFRLSVDKDEMYTELIDKVCEIFRISRK